MKREDFSMGLINLYEEKVEGGLDLFEIKPWEVRVGQVVTIRQDIENLRHARFGIYLKDIRVKQVKPFTITPEILKNIHNNKRVIHIVNGVEIELWMLSPMSIGVDFEKFEMPKRVEKPIYSVKSKTTHNEEIIEEMKSKVDKVRLRKLLSIGASTRYRKYFVSEDKVEEYLDIWAHAKYDMYIMFGRELKIETQYSKEMDSRDMSAFVTELCYKFPKYAHWLNHFDTNEYINNRIAYIGSSVEKYVSFAKVGMKISTFFNKLFEDEQFNIELSKAMQNKMIQGFLCVSIDPYDYLTMSVNKHDWRSCHRINGGEYATGCFSYLLDSTTMIAYKHNGRDYEYQIYGYAFEGNSKTFRQCVYFDTSSCNIIFGRNYPNSDDYSRRRIFQLLQKQICKHLQIPENTEWILDNEYEGSYQDYSDLHYSDVQAEFDYTFSRIAHSRSNVAHFRVGSDAPCLLCDNTVEYDSCQCLCRDCED